MSLTPDLLRPEEVDARIGDYAQLLGAESVELSRCGERILRQPVVARTPFTRR